jgi:hypothetical protein
MIENIESWEPRDPRDIINPNFRHDPTKARLSRKARFWGIMIALCITNLLCALESTMLITSLPVVVKDLKMGNEYVWVNNVFYLSR